MKTNNKIYQLKISLVDAKPPIWRRIEINTNANFADLHNCIQAVMDWDDSHLFQFKAKETEAHLLKSFAEEGHTEDIDAATLKVLIAKDASIGLIDEYADYLDYNADEEYLNEWLMEENQKIKYEYDFGDNWKHSIVLEKVLDATESVTYPRLITGEGAAPCDDCGGLWGYYAIVKAAKNPKDPDHEEAITWFDKDWDLAKFDLEEATERLKNAFTNDEE